VSTYEAHVTRDGNWWTISVPAVDGSTQAPTISDVTSKAKEHVAVTLDALSDVVGLYGRNIQKRGKHPGCNVWHVEETEKPKRASLDNAETAVAQCDAGSHLQVARRQLVEPQLLGTQSIGQPLQPPMRLGCEPGAHDPQRQRQVPTHSHHCRGRLRLACHAV
jgi:hypothetical protein